MFRNSCRYAGPWAAYQGFIVQQAVAQLLQISVGNHESFLGA